VPQWTAALNSLGISAGMGWRSACTSCTIGGHDEIATHSEAAPDCSTHPAEQENHAFGFPPSSNILHYGQVQ
jgi:hypothetical protein